MERTLTEDERAMMQHMMMWGSDGYPVAKRGRRWFVDDWRTVKGPNTSFRTKREAVAQFERQLDVLRDLHAQERRAQAEGAR
jgi:hypothetical protein